MRDLEPRSRLKLGTLGLDLAVLVSHRGKLRSVLRRHLRIPCQTDIPKSSIDVQHFNSSVHDFRGHWVLGNVESMQSGVFLKNIQQIYEYGFGQVVLYEFEGF